MHYIIIPYRDNPNENREKHKNFFIKNSIPLLKKCLDEVQVIFVIQDHGTPFNRGALINIAVNMTNSNNEDVFITHDVDINPYVITIYNYYISNISNGCIQGIYTSAWDTLGGIIKFKKKDFIKMNGFNNFFWGWGGEDNDLQNRATFNNFWIQKNLTNRPGDRNKWFYIFNHLRSKKKGNSLFKKYILNEFPKFSREKVIKYIQTNGMNTTKYNVTSDVTEENIRYINVSIPYEEENINNYLNFLKKIN